MDSSSMSTCIFHIFDISDSKPLATKLDDGSGTNEVSSTNRLNDTLDENEMSAPIDTSMESLNEASQLDNTVSAWNNINGFNNCDHIKAQLNPPNLMYVNLSPTHLEMSPVRVIDLPKKKKKHGHEK